MIIQTVTNQKYSKSDNSSIDCLVKFVSFDAAIPYTASNTDTTEHGRALWAGLKAGTYGEIAAYEAPDDTGYIATLTESEAELYNLSKTRPNEVNAAKNEYNLRQREAVAAEILALMN